MTYMTEYKTPLIDKGATLFSPGTVKCQLLRGSLTFNFGGRNGIWIKYLKGKKVNRTQQTLRLSEQVPLLG